MRILDARMYILYNLIFHLFIPSFISPSQDFALPFFQPPHFYPFKNHNHNLVYLIEHVLLAQKTWG